MPTPMTPIAMSVMPTRGTKYALVHLISLSAASHLDVDHAADDPEAQRHQPRGEEEDDEPRPVLHRLEVVGILQLERDDQEERDGEEDVP